MAVPKRRTSKQRKRKRRTHYRAAPTQIQVCDRCGDPRRPHRACPTCGFYGDRQVVAVGEES
ncbi:MAG: 50S ribosomal protein L32 [Gemmatimonadetes bacterium]|nr:50S ribosomal protein L32 [Gemmatimonadota bacterium]